MVCSTQAPACLPYISFFFLFTPPSDLTLAAALSVKALPRNDTIHNAVVKLLSAPTGSNVLTYQRLIKHVPHQQTITHSHSPSREYSHPRRSNISVCQHYADDLLQAAGQALQWHAASWQQRFAAAKLYTEVLSRADGDVVAPLGPSALPVLESVRDSDPSPYVREQVRCHQTLNVTY